MSFGREDSIKSKATSCCAICGAKLLPKAMFCFECGPPLPLGKEPEETGISLDQALFRIGALVLWFMSVILVKLDGSGNGLFPEKDKEGKTGALIESKNIQDNSFEAIHTVIPSSANIRSKPSMDGKVVAIAEQGMNLTIVERNQDWSKVRVFEITGWIATRLIKTEIQAIE